MKDKQIGQNHTSINNPTSILQAALEQIEVFTKLGAGNLDVQDDGKIVATTASGLDKIKGLVRSLVGPVFSAKLRQEQERKINQIKQQLLNARDIIQSHSLLIEKFREGDPTEQKWAQWAFESIKSYNAIVSQSQNEEKQSSKYDSFNYERSQLLLDEEIKGKEIRLPHAVSIKFDSNPNNHPAQKTFKEISQGLQVGAEAKTCSAISPTPKKMDQVMLDAFRMKGIRKIQHHWESQQSIAEIMTLVQKTPISVHEESDSGLISMRQILEIIPGSILILTGAFKKQSVNSKLMSFPILEDFHLSLQFTQTGFPYPSQHTAWALSDSLVDARPMRSEHAPLFSAVEVKKKKIAQDLLYDPVQMTRAKQIHMTAKKCGDTDPSTLLHLHRGLHESLIKESGRAVDIDTGTILDNFYSFVETALSCFDILAQVQQKIVDLFFDFPFRKIQEEWLNGNPQLREGSYPDKLRVAADILNEERTKALRNLELEENPVNKFIHLMGQVLGLAGQSIILQFMSEKIGFAPPMLSDFEQKMQTCAFQHLLTFMDQLELGVKDQTEEEAQQQFEANIKKDMEIFSSTSIDAFGLAADLTQELEVYFNSRFYAANQTKK